MFDGEWIIGLRNDECCPQIKHVLARPEEETRHNYRDHNNGGQSRQY
jgi:hypothetical protein